MSERWGPARMSEERNVSSMSADRDLAEAIYHEITDDVPQGYTDAALTIWDGTRGQPRRDRMGQVIAFVACVAIDKVLARRQREAARTGPWDGRNDP